MGKDLLYKNGEAFEYDGNTYVVGDKVIANKNSIYEGLIGTICEMHIGADTETDNKTPDIYCQFQHPIMAVNKEKARKRLSEAYKKDVSFDDVGTDRVVMSPDMIIPISELCNYDNTKKIYILIEDTAIDENSSVSAEVFSDLNIARTQMELKLIKKFEDGMLNGKELDNNYIFEETEDSYECYRASCYCEWHYSLKHVEQDVNMGGENI